ncbi:Crp/Fnr family transcriptional regulator [Streptacidiphilus cavernicola]|uniref:Crp/Fnr family transcriptional regulator n=1 Tax=Streptacidiphilus cavernicola TaxID=3342716 RepID=A0ABV6VZG8_9ACTN
MDGREQPRPGSTPGRRVRGDWGWPPASMLGSLDESARNRLLALGALTQYPEPGRVLMRESDPTSFVLILLDGVVKVTGQTQSGRDALLAVRMGGDLVGELTAVDGQARSATVTTCGTVVARAVGQADFLDCLRREPRIAHAVNQSVVTKLREANSRQIDFTGSDAPTRLARVLYQIAESYGVRNGNRVEIHWPLTQPELAELAGAAEPTVHKALRQLRAAGVVSTGYRTVTVNDLERLKRIAYPAS